MVRLITANGRLSSGSFHFRLSMAEIEFPESIHFKSIFGSIRSEKCFPGGGGFLFVTSNLVFCWRTTNILSNRNSDLRIQQFGGAIEKA
jgi:hypothetical protein